MTTIAQKKALKQQRRLNRITKEIEARMTPAELEETARVRAYIDALPDNFGEQFFQD